MRSKDTTGIWFKVNPKTGYILSINIVAKSDQEQAVVEDALARISKPSCWLWVRRLIHPRKALPDFAYDSRGEETRDN